MEISAPDFEFIRGFAEEAAGLSIESGKEYLVERRLAPIVKEYGLGSIGAVVSRMRMRPGEDILRGKLIDALTINETSFFRDSHPFAYICDRLLPEIVKKNAHKRSLSVWSAACSTGQEIHSLAIAIRERFPSILDWDLSLVGTDISRRSLEYARRGMYSNFETNRGLDPELKAKYFRLTGLEWQIVDSIKEMVTFKYLNLIETWPHTEKFDIILLRNVLIYFDLPVKQQILQKTKERLAVGGHLLVGATESTFNIDDDWVAQVEGTGVSYQLNGRDNEKSGNEIGI